MPKLWNIFVKIVQNKDNEYLCSQDVQKYKKTMESFLPIDKYCWIFSLHKNNVWLQIFMSFCQYRFLSVIGAKIGSSRWR